MNANSKGLEVNVEVSRDELNQLPDMCLEGILDFENFDGSSKQIPIAISLSQTQKPYLEVRQWPNNDYFGKAINAAFKINPEFYGLLKEHKTCEARFYNSGKLNIEVVD